jgi:hypothetical protein
VVKVERLGGVGGTPGCDAEPALSPGVATKQP